MDEFSWRKVLMQHEWVEGRIVPIATASYRHRIVAVCTDVGRQKTQFANGEFPFFSYMEVVRSDGSWVQGGNSIVPILPDGRLIMVVEQRPSHYRYANQPTHIEIDGGGRIPLVEFGPYSSLEFPGGGIGSEESFTAEFLRELIEETGVADQSAMLYWCNQPHYGFGSDIASESHLGVIYLSKMGFEGYVRSDGGLHVLALTRDEVQRNVWNGTIRSGQAAHLAWAFYKEVADADVRTLQSMQYAGYLKIKQVMIRR